MDHYKRLLRELRNYYLFLFILFSSVIAAGLWIGIKLYDANPTTLVLSLWGGSIAVAIVFALAAAHYAAEPTRALWQAILHVSREESSLPAPDLKQIRVGRELVTSLVQQVYEMASRAGTSAKIAGNAAAASDDMNTMVVASMPLPVFVVDNEQTIMAASNTAMQYCGLSSVDVIGKKFFDVANLSFPSERTLDVWLDDCRKNKVKDTQTWERVRLELPDNKGVKQFDMAAYFTNKSDSGVESIVSFFDHTARYNQDDQQVSFVALAVHELRTPLTVMRGYVEVFEEELAGKMDPELTLFMSKLRASAQQLNSFVSNILNVARVEDDQLLLKLREENWQAVITGAVKDLELQAKVRGKQIETDIAKDLPTVAADRVSIHEVINNLVDNAIKYSASSEKIIIKSVLTANGEVETTVEDFGLGIPDNVLPHLFDKFYRSHRSSGQVGGTGLGLYLCKSIIEAHGGHIWVKSKEGKGSVFGFTLKPFSDIKDEQKSDGQQDGIIRGAHGWIKNHSLYRG